MDYTKFNAIYDLVVTGVEIENLLEENSPVINRGPAKEFLDHLYNQVRAVFNSSEQTVKGEDE